MVAVGGQRAGVGPEHRAGDRRPGRPARRRRRSPRRSGPRAIRRPSSPTIWRSGGAIARAAPRSGQVPTTTLTPAIAQPADRGAERGGRAPAGRRRLVASLVPTRITATSGAGAEQRPGHLGGQVGTARSGDGDAGQLDPVALGGQQLGELAADGLGHLVDADAERGRVAEQHQPQRRRVVLAVRGAQRQARDPVSRTAGPARAPPRRRAPRRRRRCRRSARSSRRARPAAADACQTHVVRPILLLRNAVGRGSWPLPAPCQYPSATCPHRAVQQAYGGTRLTVGSCGRSTSWRTRCRSCAQRLAGSVAVAETAVALTSVPGWVAASAAASDQGADADPVAQHARRRSGVPDRSEASTVGRIAPAAAGVADRGRVEPVGAEHPLRRRVELRAEQVAERDGPRAGVHRRDRLRGGQFPAPPAGQPAQRRLDRPDRAEIRAGADDHLGARRRGAGAPPWRGAAPRPVRAPGASRRWRRS